MPSPHRPIAIVLNNGAGHPAIAAWAAEKRDALHAAAQGGPVHCVHSGDALDRAVRDALSQGCAAVIAGGGDGTVNAVASHLVGSNVALGVLPLGTLNHFAKDVGIPLDLDQALQQLQQPASVRVDVGEVNGRYFLNNSSLGLYPAIVRHRERQQQRLGRSKWLALGWATWSTLRQAPFLTVQLEVDGRSARLRTPLVFVGNNAYELDGFQIGRRPSLDDGALSLYVATCTSRPGLLRLGLGALAGRLRRARDFHAWRADALQIDAPHRTLAVATDGEVQRMPTPLRYRIHRQALRVIAPLPAAPDEDTR